MKPGYIFIAVLLISVFMVSLLPRLGQASGASTNMRAQASVNRLPIVTVIPTSDAEQAELSLQKQIAAPTVVQQPSPQFDESNANEVSTIDDEALRGFASKVQNGQPGTISGVYTPGLFALPVTGQPGGDENYISTDENVLTQYGTPAQFGVIALLAHNYLNSGKLIANLSPDQVVYLVYGDGKVARFRVTRIEYYQALSPHDTRSDFRDLNGPGGKVLSYAQLFDRVYTTSNQLVFQTCLEANGELSWGRIFILAEPTS